MCHPGRKKNHEMGRVKDAKDWLLTWSPKEGVHDIPPKIREFMEGSDITRYYAVIEEAGKAHLHIAFSTRCTYNSDYAWWKPLFEKAGFVCGNRKKDEHALDIKYHDWLVTCAGGYFDGRCVGRKGISDEQLEYGGTQFELRQCRQRVRQLINDLIVIPKDKYEATIGAIMADQEVDRKTAEQLAVEIGFAFGTSKRGHIEDYAEMFRERKKMS